MVSRKPQSAIWQASSHHSDWQYEGELAAYWEVAGDAITDDYTPQEMHAEALFSTWAKKVKAKYPNGLIPIHWFVAGEGISQVMPFQFPHLAAGEDFLTDFTWPVNKQTGERLNWLALPVADKLWNRKRADKGGFIQEYTGWKPGILQSYVYLPSLLQSRGIA